MRWHSSTRQSKGQSQFLATSSMPPDSGRMCGLAKFPAAFARGIMEPGGPPRSLVSPAQACGPGFRGVTRLYYPQSGGFPLSKLPWWLGKGRIGNTPSRRRGDPGKSFFSLSPPQAAEKGMRE